MIIKLLNRTRVSSRYRHPLQTYSNAGDDETRRAAPIWDGPALPNHYFRSGRRMGPDRQRPAILGTDRFLVNALLLAARPPIPVHLPPAAVGVTVRRSLRPALDTSLDVPDPRRTRPRSPCAVPRRVPAPALHRRAETTGLSASERLTGVAGDCASDAIAPGCRCHRRCGRSDTPRPPDPAVLPRVGAVAGCPFQI
jgi:hypothetical protein